MKTVIVSAVLCLIVATVAWAAPAEPAGEYIFPPQGKHCHGSSIVELPNGDLLACWFYGSGERSASDVVVQGARKAKGAKEWTAPFLMADTPNFSDCNPVLWLDGQKRLWLTWISIRADAWEGAILMFRRCDDPRGKAAPNWNWQGVIALKPGDEFSARIQSGFKELTSKTGYEEAMWCGYAPKYSLQLIEASKDLLKRQLGWMTRIHPLTLKSGRILLPLYSDGYNVSMVAITDDNGENWRASEPIVGLGPIQPTLVQKKDGSIAAYMRDSGQSPDRVMWATSTTQGDTWSIATDTDIPNPGSSLECIVLKDGRWVMIYNDTEKGRHSLALSMSDDEGATWKWKRHIQLDEAKKSGYAYPSMVQTRDGRIHATYTFSEGQGKTIKHLIVDPAWIEAGDAAK